MVLPHADGSGVNTNIISHRAGCGASRAALLGGTFIIAVILLAAPAHAQSQVAVSLLAQKVTVKEGKEILVSAERAVPGEVIQYDARYQNQGKRAVQQLAPTLPIPAGMVFVPNSAVPAPAQASLDGKSFAALPLKRQVTRPDGRVVEEEIPATEFRALRWQVGDLAAAGKTNVIARARLAQR